VAKLPPYSTPFRHTARLKDGRSRKAAEVTFEPRPVVTHVEAFVVLPDYVGRKPDGSSYEQPQAQGDVFGYAGFTARVVVATQKPIARARLTRLTRSADGATEVALGQPIAGTVIDGEHGAELVFPLESNVKAYRVEVEDRNGFASLTRPRRTVTVPAGPPPPPDVDLHPERFAPFAQVGTEANDVEGMPLPFQPDQDMPVRIVYSCRSPFGLSRAVVKYKVNDGPEQLGKVCIEPALPPDTERFDARRGGFVGRDAKGGLRLFLAEFHALPSADPERFPDRLEGAGAWDFKTSQLEKVSPEGVRTKLEVGDRVEYWVEVYDRIPDPDRPPGRSPPRVKTVVTPEAFEEWIDAWLQSAARLKKHEERQRAVFVPKRPPQ
jgi:hypothetical protein